MRPLFSCPISQPIYSTESGFPLFLFIFSVWKGHWWVRLGSVLRRWPVPGPARWIPVRRWSSRHQWALWGGPKRPVFPCLSQPLPEPLPASLLPHSVPERWASGRVGPAGSFLTPIRTSPNLKATASQDRPSLISDL